MALPTMNTENEFDLVVIGAGIVGLATAMEALRRAPGLRLCVVEKEAHEAAHQTGHNSGVIHSGIYYKPGSMRAKLGVAGAAAMVDFCREHGIPHEVCGKVIVAVNDNELPALRELKRRADVNGVPGVREITPEELREYEPHTRGVAALHLPSTGITDYKLVSAKYADIIRKGGGEIAFNAGVRGIRERGGELVIETAQGEVRTRAAVNCAGAYSDRIATMAGAQPESRVIPFRGEYYSLAGESAKLVRGLIYPVPDTAVPYLGVHFTRRITGEIEAGPNAVLALSREGYRKTDIDTGDIASMLSFPGFWRMASRLWRIAIGEQYRSFSKAAFVRALQKLVPELRDSDLSPGGSGVRAQAVSRDGKLIDDFRFVHTGRMVHVLNVPSPAATTSLLIGKEVVDMLEQSVGLRQAVNC
jgi:(S)-2-hydroxyglutarate dehydrogenase